MLLDLNQKFVSLEGKVLQDAKQVPDGKDKDGRDKFKTELSDLTLYRVLLLALIEPVHKLLDGDKEKYFEIALKINAAKAGMVEVTAEEITILKKAVRPKFGVLIVGETLRMLEGRDIGIETTENKILDESETDDPETQLSEIELEQKLKSSELEDNKEVSKVSPVDQVVVESESENSESEDNKIVPIEDSRSDVDKELPETA